MRPSLHRWAKDELLDGNWIEDHVWQALSTNDFYAIFDSGDWRICALSATQQWFYQGDKWANIQPFTVDSSLACEHDHTPPFLEGMLSIVSFDGRLHAWMSDHSLTFHRPSKSWYFWGTPLQRQTLLTQIKQDRRTHCTTLSVQATPSHSMPEAVYKSAVQEVIDAIHDGNVYQINLANAVEPFHIAQPLNTWLRLTRENPARHAFFWQSPSEILIGNSPELFLQFTNQGLVHSLPIKGTQSNIDNPNAHFTLWDSPKEQAELTMIVDMMRNDLSMVSEFGTVFVEHRRLRRCGDLLHAEQKVVGQLTPSISTLQAVHACFPPASVTGAPKRAALSYIRDLEPVNRRWYTGSFGFMDRRGHSTWNVIIRTLQGIPNGDGSCSATLNIGSGIVYDSVPAAEWAETESKGRAISRVLDDVQTE